MNDEDEHLKCKGHHRMYTLLRYTCSIVRIDSLSFGVCVLKFWMMADYHVQN